MIKGIELKKFKEIEGHGDSRTFSAEIWMDGKEIGWVGNNGWGGSNEYRIPTDSKKFDMIVNEWANEKGETFEIWDSFIEELIINTFEQKTKKKNEKKGLKISVHCMKGKYKTGGKIFWKEEWIAGLKDQKEIQPYLHLEKVEEHRIL